MPGYSPNDILLDKYRIEAKLGQGSFGDVYLVTYLPLNQPRALKVLRREFLTDKEFESAQKHFMDEAQLGGELNSPNPNPHLLMIYEPILNEEMAGIVMEYASGGSLTRLMQQAAERGQNIPVAQAVQIAIEVAQGLSPLHVRGEVHRDIKPSNILFDQQGHARVADLGLVQSRDDKSDRRLTSKPAPQPGGTGYASPEQETSGNLLKPPSDIYSLGVVLFEMLTGRNYTMLKPGTRAASMRKDTPAELDNLLTRMLSKDPEKRPWDGAEAARLLRGVLEEKRKPQLWLLLVLAILLALLWFKSCGQTPLPTPAPLIILIPTSTRASMDSIPNLPTIEREATSTPTLQVVATPVLTDTPLPSPSPTVGKGSSRIRKKDGMEMMYLPGESFTMSAGGDEHTVTLDSYWIDKTEVTNAKYAMCVQTGGCTEPSSKISNSRQSYYLNSQFGNYPVIFVNWNQSKAYCEWAGAKLPTEAQWELAARGQDGRTYPWGEIIDPSFANYNQNIGDTTEVCQYEKGNSPYGLCDMAGNVWEWVGDWYGNYPTAPVANPSGPLTGQFRVLRGGSWSNIDHSIRAANRYSYSPSRADYGFGFRCASNTFPKEAVSNLSGASPTP